MLDDPDGDAAPAFAPGEFDNRTARMLNCSPSSFIPAGARGQPCNRAFYCPHCWGRQALES